MYTYREAQIANLFKDSVTMVFQDKEGPIHQGHVNLIKYAKTIGRPVVMIQSHSREQIAYFLFGNVPTSLSEENLNPEISSLEEQGVDVVVRPCLFNIREQRRLRLLELAKAVIQPYEKDLIITRKINLCVYRYMVHYAWRNIFKSVNARYYLSGPDPSIYVWKDVYRQRNLEDRNINYHEFTKDPETGLKFGSRDNRLTKEERKCLKDLKKDIKFDDIGPGHNNELLKKVNSNKNSSLWEAEYIIRYHGSIFGDVILDYYSFRFKDSGVVIEDIDLG